MTIYLAKIPLNLIMLKKLTAKKQNEIQTKK